MRMEEDWRLAGQEKYLQNASLYKVTFPEFWEIACRDKNKFYQIVERQATSFVEQMHRGQEYLTEDKLLHFWHEHCEFCWTAFSAHEDDMHSGYCTPDYYRWICEECFQDFQEMFGWTVIDDTPKTSC